MAERGSSPAKDTSDREIVISRVFDAPRELVWDAWTDPKQLVQWWGPRGFTTTIQEMDVRPGGVWRHTMHGPDGTDYPNESVFLEVAKPERIVFSHGGGKKGEPSAEFVSTWTLEARDNKTKLTLRMVFPSAEARDRVVKTYNAVEGGNQTLSRLAEQLAKAPVIIERTFNAPIEKVWRAITNIEAMKQWWPQLAPLKSFHPEVGFEAQFNVHHQEKDFLHLWKVTEVVPGKKITYDWKYEGYPGNSSISFELFSEGNKTRLKLTHRGLETFLPESNPDLARGNFLMGWTGLVSLLGQFVENKEADLIVTRVFDAPRELVFKAWTDPKHVSQWFGPRGFTNPVCELDPRPGGSSLIHMRAPDGTTHQMTGVYHEVVRPERLVYLSWVPDKENALFEVLTTVTFVEESEKTKLTTEAKVLKSTPEAAPMLAGMEEGWKQTLDRLGEHLAKP